MSKPAALGLPLAEWPEASRQAWQSNVKRQRWKGKYPAAIRRGVERWFMFAGADALPTPELVAAYEGWLLETVSQRSALTYLQHLAYGIQLVAPDARCEWLVRNVLDRLPRPAAKPPAPMKAQTCRLALPVSEWPVEWRAPWQAITTREARSRFRRRHDSPTAGWSASYRQRVERGVGQLAAFVVAHDRAPVLSADLIHDFLDSCADRGISGQSMSMYAGEVHRAFTLIGPRLDLRWLYELAEELGAAPPVRNKAHRLMGIREIQKAGLDLMRRARQRPLTTETALQYRDGLIIAAWPVRPYRLSNFTALTLDESLLVTDDWATIVVHQTKNDDGLITPWPPNLFSDLTEYLGVYRAYLIDDNPDDGRLWIGRGGRPLTTGGLSRHIGDVTEDLFGHRINPHLMRDCCITSIVEEDPRESLRASALAGHRDPRTTKKHYQHASSHAAAKITYEMLEGFRMPPAARIKTKR